MHCAFHAFDRRSVEYAIYVLTVYIAYWNSVSVPACKCVYMHTHTHAWIFHIRPTCVHKHLAAGRQARPVKRHIALSHRLRKHTDKNTDTEICLWRQATCALPGKYQIFLLWGMSQNMLVSCPPAYLYVCSCAIITIWVNTTTYTNTQQNAICTHLLDIL
jgi:hypothetical protein